VRIAYVSGGTDPREWERSATQQSPRIRLEKGKKYYIEAMHKAVDGNDHLAVGWEMPDGTQEMPINGARLASFIPSEKEYELPTMSEGTMSLFPNPASDQVNVRFNVQEEQDAVITIANLTAQQLISVTQPVVVGENVVPLQIGGLTRGVYVVYVQTREGKVSRRLVVAR
jgi:hypothetical protein